MKASSTPGREWNAQHKPTEEGKEPLELDSKAKRTGENGQQQRQSCYACGNLSQRY
jgi:hypothetical protein